MYDPAFTIARVAEAEREFETDIVYHSLEDVDEWIERLGDVYDEDGRQTRKLTSEEHNFITNERRICAIDFRYWSSHYAYIRSWRGQIQRFAPNIAQGIVLDLWSELEAAGHAIMMQQLKARQLGVTTLTELAITHRVQFHPDVNAVVASSSPEQSSKMAKMMELNLGSPTTTSMQPWWLLPTRTKYNTGSLIEYGGQNSAVSIQAGNQITGIARGTTPDVVHLSELADFPDPEELVDASLLRAAHESASLFVILESTAKGRHNWWHRTWEFNQANWAIGRSRLCPIFLPWFIGRDIYPTDTWIHTRPIPEDWTPAALTLQHAERAMRSARANPRLRKYLGETWVMPREQMWFYEVERDEARAKKELSLFLGEMPSDDLEAFQSTNHSAFDTDVIVVYREAIRDPIGVYAIIGDPDEIPKRFHPDQRSVDTNRPPIPIRASWGRHDMSYELVPLRFEGYQADPHGKLFIWEWPRDEHLYGMGVDTGDGIGEDRSGCELLRKGDSIENDAQVAEFFSPYINAYNLWPMAYALATLYSTYWQGERKQCKAVIECRGNGEHVQLEMRKRGWSHFHQWMRYDGKRLRLKDANKIGWFTNQWSRAAMLDFLMSALGDDWLDINSPWFVDEMSDLERDDVHQSMKAMYGGHDDRFMALGMALFSLHVMETRGAKKLERHRSHEDDEDPLYHPGFQGSSALPSGDMSTFLRLFGQGVRGQP